jgi:hypothetical protein
MALTKSAGSICDWTALAANAAALAGTLDVSDAYGGLIHIQAFVDEDNKACSGVEFIVQGRSNASDTNEDWYDITRFLGLVSTNQAISINGNVATDDSSPLLDENPSTVWTSAPGTADGPMIWVGVEDAGALADSELIAVYKTDADEVFIVGSNEAGTEYLENAKDTSDTMSQYALSQMVSFGAEHIRLRVIVNNNYDYISGPTINYRVRYIKVTAL